MADNLGTLTSQIHERVAARRDDIIRFMRDLCRIPSMESQLGEVGERAAQEMRALGFDKVWFDSMGNIVGQIGSGPTVIVYDSHIDTVGTGDANQWEWDPFEGKVEDGILYARGAGDEKQSTPGMVYGLAIARDLGLLDGYTAYYFGNMEEWCDGIAPHAFVEHEGIKPNYVVIGEPTKMGIYRGHKGRVEMQVIAKGKAAHAASNERGDNAVYKVLPVIAGVRDMNDTLPTDDFLGQGRITVTKVDVETPSINAVPDKCVVTIDRRVTWGEKKEDAVAQVEALIPEKDRNDVRVELMFYDEPSYTGFVFPVEKYFPAWQLPEEHPLVEAGQRAYEALWGERTHVGKWGFSTNGIYWAGKAGIPSIGFAAGDEIYAHSILDQVPLEDMVRATAWYALLPVTLKQVADRVEG
ncbi:MAG TPA: YgeY family selenium metabolism-linked hydrolase [Chloroflexi bacterium]|nr:YgeY family selenium metabolism-linked hydrolase [Chloroflexota bacterium]